MDLWICVFANSLIFFVNGERWVLTDNIITYRSSRLG